MSALGARLLLASASPRRAALLAQAGIPYEAVATDVAETVPAGTPPREAVALLAERKARAVARGEWVLAADTLGDLDGEALGKPAGPQEAEALLARLSGRTHLVHTGLHLRHAPTGREWRHVETTAVTFARLAPEQIRAYVATGEPLGKAGAYAIQGLAGALVARVDGCYFNVVGLPLAATVKLLHEAGFPLPPALGGNGGRDT